ncbi:NUDIX hydrolase [Niallia sp. NCCP-28]|uniref:NUDIX hydrolase n=1 Tax=Niallia sp. NCCP-28 TaxID=2934712 RepID=UPI00208A8FB8|nr:NUDIX domain-containing protein [Niallia sp. NCCP-28]GKU82983.1 hypothetical protein NCCP28_23790 [Niallia sp. NCCP-28]
MSQKMVLAASVSIIQENKVLIIKENKSYAINKWNFPGGRIEYGEDILYSACREVKEETGFDVELNGTTGVYNFSSNTDDQVILFHFTGKIIGGSLQLEEEIISESMWMKATDLLLVDYEQLREPKVFRQITDKLIKKDIHSIDIFNKQLNR